MKFRKIQLRLKAREIILSTATSMLNRLYIHDDQLNFTTIATKTLSDIVNFLRSQEINIEYKGFRINKSNNLTWQERAFASKQLLEKLTGQISMPVNIFITIDRLDAAFRHDDTNAQRNSYLRLLEGLMNAAQEIHESNPIGGQVRIFPIVLIRSDIMNLVTNSDKTKWEDETIDLVWNGYRIRELLAHRLSIAAGEEDLNFDQAWHRLFEKFTIEDRYESGRPKSAFDYIEFRTSWSPRDYIVYLRECAKFASARNEDQVTLDRMVYTEFNYSAFVRKQLIDEGLPHIQDLQIKLDQLSVMAKAHSRKRNFQLSDFSEAMKIEDIETANVLEKLYDLNAVGNLQTGASGHPHNRFKFRYKDQFLGTFEKHGSIVIHPGLYRSLT